MAKTETEHWKDGRLVGKTSVTEDGRGGKTVTEQDVYKGGFTRIRKETYIDKDGNKTTKTRDR